MTDYIEKASGALFKWGITALVVLWTFCTIMAFSLDSPIVVIFGILSLLGVGFAVFFTIISLVEIAHALETWRIGKKDKNHYRVRGGYSSDDAKWIDRLELLGRWLDRKNAEKPEQNQ